MLTIWHRKDQHFRLTWSRRERHAQSCGPRRLRSGGCERLRTLRGGISSSSWETRAAGCKPRRRRPFARETSCRCSFRHGCAKAMNTGSGVKPWKRSFEPGRAKGMKREMNAMSCVHTAIGISKSVAYAWSTNLGYGFSPAATGMSAASAQTV